MLEGNQPGKPGIYTDVASLRRWIDAASACLLAGVQDMSRCPGAATCADFPERGCAACDPSTPARCASCTFPGWRVDNTTGVVRPGAAGCTADSSRLADVEPPLLRRLLPCTLRAPTFRLLPLAQCLPTTCKDVPAMRCATCDAQQPLRCGTCADAHATVDASGTCAPTACLARCSACSACSVRQPWRCTACRQPGEYRLDSRSGRCVPRRGRAAAGH